jgi:dihydrolipoamide dehydrogenase
LLIATGRRPRVHGIGLETIGIEPDERGIAIDERCRVVDGVWAIGDVTGVMPFTHVGKYQACIAAADIAGKPVPADYRAIPRVVFKSDWGAAGARAGARRRDLAGRSPQDDRSPIHLRAGSARRARPRRRERGVLVGAWAWAPMAGEWIHYAALAIKARVSLDVLSDTVAQFPTYTEAFLEAVETLG